MRNRSISTPESNKHKCTAFTAFTAQNKPQCRLEPIIIDVDCEQTRLEHELRARVSMEEYKHTIPGEATELSTIVDNENESKYATRRKKHKKRLWNSKPHDGMEPW